MSDLKRLIRQPAGKTQYGYVHRGLLDGDYPTSFDFYSEETAQLRQEVGELGQRAKLGQIADIFLGNPLPHLGTSGDYGISDVLTIRAKDITADGRVDLTNLGTCSRPSEVRDLLQEGDFCIRQIRASGKKYESGIPFFREQ